jgi:hypothetical protein
VEEQEQFSNHQEPTDIDLQTVVCTVTLVTRRIQSVSSLLASQQQQQQQQQHTTTIHQDERRSNNNNNNDDNY